ncbi:MAG: hypothetical protein WB716_03115, partial [Candidatus Acidiferrales bacterium]
LAAAGLLLAAALAFVFVRPYLNQPKPNVARFLVSPPSEVTAWGLPHVSPDGRLLAFVGISNKGVRQLWLRPLDSVAAHALPGTEDAIPFWSPDSRYLGFFASGSLKKIDVAGGPPQVLSEGVRGSTGSWNSGGVIVFSGSGGSLEKVSQAGGAPSPLTTLDQSVGEIAQSNPMFMPDGRHFIYASRRLVPLGQLWVCFGSLDSKATKCLMSADSPAVYAQPGYLLYLRAGTLVAQSFDAQRLAVTGDAVPIAEGVLDFSVSASGVLAYTAGTSAQAALQLQWFDRSGKKLGTVGQAALYSNPALSPDGTRVAVGIRESAAGNRNLWILDLKRGTASRLTFDSADDLNPVWSRDGSQILFSSTKTGARDIYEKAASGLGDSQLVFESKDQQKSLEDWSSDGRYVVYNITAAPSSLWILPLFGDRKPLPFVQGTFNAREARFSPNGRYIAYASDETGNYQIYVQTFPQQGGKWQVSTAGGLNPEWRRDGKELYFLSNAGLMAVDVDTTGPQFEVGIPKPLFDANIGTNGFPNAPYRVSADGQRFLAITAAEQQYNSPITVVLNWAAELKR